jgi:hypothetical protein
MSASSSWKIVPQRWQVSGARYGGGTGGRVPWEMIFTAPP